MKRLLMYSQDGMGLGHLRRSWNIAREIKRHEPECDVLVLADSPATSLFCRDRGIECVKLPTIVKSGSLRWRNDALAMPCADIIALRSALILETFRRFAPDTMLVDHMPVGALGELLPVLDHRRKLADPPRLLLGLRDILDAEDVIRDAWSTLGAYDYLADYEAVLIYGCEDVFDADAAYGLRQHARRVVYCNYVSPVDGGGHNPQPDVRARGHVPERPFILMMGGGGHDSFALAEAFVKVAPGLQRSFGLDAVLLTGPNMAFARREALISRGARASVTILDGVEDATEWIRNASAVVSMAGYNSMCEVLAWRKKALVVPRRGPSVEQRTRTRLLAERDLVSMIDPDDLTPARLADGIELLLSTDRVPDATRLPALDGARRAASIVLGHPFLRALPLDGGDGRIRVSASGATHSPPAANGSVAHIAVPAVPVGGINVAASVQDGESLAVLDLPMLGSLLDTEWMRRILRATLPRTSEWRKLRLGSAVLVGGKRGARALVAYEMSNGHPVDGRGVFAKHFADAAQARRVFGVMSELAGSTFRGSSRLGSPRPLALIPELATLLYVPASGSSLGDLVLDSDGERLIRRTARWLSRFHDSKITLDRRLDIESELRTVRSWVDTIAEARPPHAGAAARIADWLCEAAPGLQLDVAVPIHKDFHYGHVIVGPKLSVIDFDEVRLGDRAFDVAHFCAYLRLLGHRRKVDVRGLEKAFLRRYTERTGWKADGSFRFFFRYSCLKIARQLCTDRGVAPHPTGRALERELTAMLGEAAVHPEVLARAV